VLEVWLDVGAEVDGVGVLFDELEVLEVLFAVEEVVLEVVCETDEDFDAVGKFVLVLPRPWSPIIVCASPSGIENVPLPLLQSQLPESTEDWQHQLPFPQFCNEPLFEEPVSSKQKSPHAVSFQLGFVHVPLNAVPTGNAFPTAVSSVTTHKLFEKHAHPNGQHSVVYAYGSHGYCCRALSCPPG